MGRLTSCSVAITVLHVAVEGLRETCIEAKQSYPKIHPAHSTQCSCDEKKSKSLFRSSSKHWESNIFHSLLRHKKTQAKVSSDSDCFHFTFCHSQSGRKIARYCNNFSNLPATGWGQGCGCWWWCSGGDDAGQITPRHLWDVLILSAALTLEIKGCTVPKTRGCHSHQSPSSPIVGQHTPQLHLICPILRLPHHYPALTMQWMYMFVSV